MLVWSKVMGAKVQAKMSVSFGDGVDIGIAKFVVLGVVGIDGDGGRSSKAAGQRLSFIDQVVGSSILTNERHLHLACGDEVGLEGVPVVLRGHVISWVACNPPVALKVANAEAVVLLAVEHDVIAVAVGVVFKNGEKLLARGSRRLRPDRLHGDVVVVLLERRLAIPNCSYGATT